MIIYWYETLGFTLLWLGVSLVYGHFYDKHTGVQRRWWPAWYRNDDINTIDQAYKKTQRGSSLTRKNTSVVPKRLGVQILPSPPSIEGDIVTRDVTLNSSMFMGRLMHED